MGVEKDSGYKLTQMVYLLQALSFVLGVTYIVAVVVNYAKADEVKGTIYESHFRWQIRTFWFSILWAVVGGALIVALGLGLLVLLVNVVWVIYRIAVGWLALSDGRAMYVPKTGAVDG